MNYFYILTEYVGNLYQILRKGAKIIEDLREEEKD
jgi:hypothetical protein